MMKFVKILLLFIGLVFGTLQAQDTSNNDIVLQLNPNYAGTLTYDNITDSALFVNDSVFNFQLNIDYNAGWMPADTETVYNDLGLPVKIIFHAKPMQKSLLADSLVISEIFFCNELDDTLNDWFELCNFSHTDCTLKNSFIQTSKGKFYLENTIEIPSQSCVVFLCYDAFDFSMHSDSLVLADEKGQIISRFVWEASRMNYPKDSIFSLEIKDVFTSEQQVSNWEIIYGNGRGGKLPELYANQIKPVSVWSWLKYVVWSVAFLLFILILFLSFRKKRNDRF